MAEALGPERAAALRGHEDGWPGNRVQKPRELPLSAGPAHRGEGFVDVLGRPQLRAEAVAEFVPRAIDDEGDATRQEPQRALDLVRLAQGPVAVADQEEGARPWFSAKARWLASLSALTPITTAPSSVKRS